MSTEETIISDNRWHVAATPLGSLIAKFAESSNNDRLVAYDACWMSTRPDIYWAHPNDPSIRYTDKQAQEMGYVINVMQKINDNYVDDVIDLIQVEGDLVRDYTPINPNADRDETVIYVNVPQLIYIYPIRDDQLNKELDEYIDRLMGRLPTKNLNE